MKTNFDEIWREAWAYPQNRAGIRAYTDDWVLIRDRIWRTLGLQNWTQVAAHINRGIDENKF